MVQISSIPVVCCSPQKSQEDPDEAEEKFDEKDDQSENPEKGETFESMMMEESLLTS